MRPSASPPQAPAAAARADGTGLAFAGYLLLMLLEYLAVADELPVLKLLRFTTLLSYGLLTFAVTQLAAERTMMRTPTSIQERAKLANTYAATLGQAPVETAQRGMEELFEKLKGFQDSFTSARYYSRLQLGVIEAVVLAVVSDDFTLGANARRWLDDDEFLVRRRVHRDVRTLMAQH